MVQGPLDEFCEGQGSVGRNLQAGVMSLPLPSQAPLPKPLWRPGATADIRRVSAMHEARISDVYENYTFKLPVKQLLIV